MFALGSECYMFFNVVYRIYLFELVGLSEINVFSLFLLMFILQFMYYVYIFDIPFEYSI